MEGIKGCYITVNSNIKTKRVLTLFTNTDGSRSARVTATTRESRPVHCHRSGDGLLIGAHCKSPCSGMLEILDLSAWVLAAVQPAVTGFERVNRNGAVMADVAYDRG